MRLLVLPGDGIGSEITRASLAVLAATSDELELGLGSGCRDGHEVGMTRGTILRPSTIASFDRGGGTSTIRLVTRASGSTSFDATRTLVATGDARRIDDEHRASRSDNASG